jgi:hypothetical protein
VKERVETATSVHGCGCPAGRRAIHRIGEEKGEERRGVRRSTVMSIETKLRDLEALGESTTPQALQ